MQNEAQAKYSKHDNWQSKGVKHRAPNILAWKVFLKKN